MSFEGHPLASKPQHDLQELDARLLSCSSSLVMKMESKPTKNGLLVITIYQQSLFPQVIRNKNELLLHMASKVNI